MSAAAGDLDFLNLGTTSVARLALPVENLCKKFEVVTLGAVGFDVGRHGGAAGSDRFIHNIPGCFKQFSSFFPSDGAGFTLGVDVSGK